MGDIIIEGGKSLETWDTSSLRGDRVYGDWLEWLLMIICGGGSVRAAITGFMRKQ